jgi:hypothetical protein
MLWNQWFLWAVLILIVLELWRDLWIYIVNINLGWDSAPLKIWTDTPSEALVQITCQAESQMKLLDPTWWSDNSVWLHSRPLLLWCCIIHQIDTLYINYCWQRYTVKLLKNGQHWDQKKLADLEECLILLEFSCKELLSRDIKNWLIFRKDRFSEGPI